MQLVRMLACLLLATPAFAVIDFTLALDYNPINVYRNGTIHTQVTLSATGVEDGTFAFATVDAPGGVTAAGWCSAWNPACPGVWMEVANGASQSAEFRVIITAGPAATLGSGTVTFHMTRGALDRTVAIPIVVLAVPAIPSAFSAPNPPPLTGLDNWRIERTTRANAWCDETKVFASFAPASEGDLWYYDGARTYALLAEETTDAATKAHYLACALNVVSQYRDWVLQGGVRGNAVFTWGLRWAYERTGTASYKNAVERLIQEGGGAWAFTIGDAHDGSIRETAYALRAIVDAGLLVITEDTTQPTYPLSERKARAVNLLLGYLHVYAANAPAESQAHEHQSFYTAYAIEALTYYYDNDTKDPRIPDTVKRTLDWYWTYMIDHDNGTILYNPNVEKADAPRRCQTYCQEPHTDLNNISLWAWYWYWRLSGDDTYRAQGDLLFEHSLDTDISYSAKIFNENFYSSQQAVRLRNVRAMASAKGTARLVGGAGMRSGGFSVPMPVAADGTDEFDGSGALNAAWWEEAFAAVGNRVDCVRVDGVATVAATYKECAARYIGTALGDDGSVQADVQIEIGRETGLIWRSSGEGTFYALEAQASYVTVYRYTVGSRAYINCDIGTGGLTLVTGTTYAMKVAYAGSTYSLYLAAQGQTPTLRGTCTDNSPLATGRPGIRIQSQDAPFGTVDNFVAQ